MVTKWPTKPSSEKFSRQDTQGETDIVEEISDREKKKKKKSQVLRIAIAYTLGKRPVATSC